MKRLPIVLAGFALLHTIRGRTTTPNALICGSLVKEKQADSSEVIKATRDFRERLLADPYRPASTSTFRRMRLGLVIQTGAFLQDGLYHLMYLYNKSGCRLYLQRR